MGRKKGITQDLILWRRMEVARLLSRGVSVKAIGVRLHVDARTIFEDQRYIRQHASEVLDKYLVETLPIELSKCLSRLNQVSDESWALVDNKQLHARERLAALARAESAAVNIIKLLTDNKGARLYCITKETTPIWYIRPDSIKHKRRTKRE